MSTLWDPMDCGPPGSSVHEFSRQEYWSDLPFPSPGDPPDPGIKPTSPALQEDSLPPEPSGKLTLWWDIQITSLTTEDFSQIQELRACMPSLQEGTTSSIYSSLDF